MTIKKRLYISFALILAIIIFIVGIFFYTIINLNNIHILQNQRYEQIRRVEHIKELNTAFAWVVLDIIVDRKNKEFVKDRYKKADELFTDLKSIENDVLINSETFKEKEKLISIFTSLHRIESFIKVDLDNLLQTNAKEEDILRFNEIFNKESALSHGLINEEIDLLQMKLNQTEKEKESFIDKIKLELIIILFISFTLTFIIASKIINEIKTMLRKLNNGVIQLLNNDEKTIKINMEEKNELSEITENINKYLSQKDAIIKSREELLRNISHELKTPITKGKFLLEKLKVKQETSTLSDVNQVFFDIEQLTSKLLERERLNSATLKKTNFKASTLILEALSKLSIDDESKIIIDIEDDFSINADFYYLTLSVKNLIDNAMKYTNSFPIQIIASNNFLELRNDAPKLTNSLTYYIQPFTREENQQHGHGLGLNIVNKILTMHEFSLSYEHKNSQNIFKITFL